MFSKYRQIKLKGPKSKIYSVSWNKSGSMLAAGAYDGKVCIWNPETTKEFYELAGNSSHVTQLCWNPAVEDQLAIATFDKTVKIWNVVTKTLFKVLQTSGGNINMTWSPDGQYLAVGNREDWLSIFNIKTGALQSHTHYGTEINEIRWDNTVSKLFVATGRGPILVFKYPEMSKMVELVGHTSNCYSLAIDPTGNMLVSGGSDSLILVWDIQHYICINSFDELEYPVRTLGFCHDGRFVASSSEDKLINIYDLHTNTLAHSIKVSSVMNVISWHPKKYIIAFAGDEREPRTNEYVVQLFIPSNKPSLSI
ncbi:hypothetical protein BB561_005956 [Smittium simulii]|uniref:Anaphase-promoting complex subunit 4-like WD40 domain-containing protein n=1 Tax=Smittium simulii TaxID=133385 RepID=A0A2T9Y7B8_9FUNG|nr:hypothetical protein BB561_005956 [Smittium simulii]